MGIKQPSLTLRAADAVKKLPGTIELIKIQRELTARVDAVDSEQQANAHKQDVAMAAGDLEELRETKQAFANLKDEELVLRRQSTEIHKAIRLMKGREAIASTPQYRKDLDTALHQATQAQAVLEECLKTVNAIIAGRRSAAEIDEKILLNPSTIVSITAAIHPKGDERTQLMIDLGINESRRAQRDGQTI